MKKKQLFVSAMAAVCATAALAGGLVACGDEEKSDALSAPAPTLSGAVLSWKAVKGAEGYVVTVNGREYNVEDTSYTIRVTEVGEYSVYVTAVKGSDKKTSKKLTYTLTDTLDAPELSLNGNVVTWNAIAHAASYEVYVNDELETTVTEARYVITEEEVGTYVVRAKSVGENKYYINSDLSDAVTYKVENSEVLPEKLDAPTITIDKRTVSWTAVKNATLYKILVDGVEYATVTGTSYDITLRDEGDYEITVTAQAPATDFVQSDTSNPVSFSVAPFDLTKPVVAYIAGNGKTAEYSSEKNIYVQSGEYNDSGLDAAFRDRAWRLIPAGSYYKIKVANGAFLTSASGRSNAWYAGDNGSDGQLWELRTADGGGYHLVNKAVGEYYYCADSATNNLHFYNIVEGSDMQVWKMFNVDVQFDADMDVLDAPELSLDGNVVSWTAVDGADEYKVYVNGEYKTTVTETSYTVQATAEGLYTVTVVAVGEGALDSVPSNGAAYMHSTLDLAEPVYATYTVGEEVFVATVDHTGYVVMRSVDDITDFAPYMWYMEADGEYYNIKFANGLYLTRVANGESDPEAKLMPKSDSADQKWKLTADGFNEYKLSNLGHANQWTGGDLGRYFYGEISGVLKFADNTHAWSFTNKDIAFGTVTALESPELSLEDNIVTWAAVDGADGYKIYVNGEYKTTATETSYTVQATEEGLYTVTVIAVGADAMDSMPASVDYTYSAFSLADPICATYTVGDAEYLAVADDNGYVMLVPAEGITDFAPYMWYLETDGEYYNIKFANGWYLTRVANGEASPEAMLMPKSNATDQQWKLTQDGYKKYKLSNVSHANQWAGGNLERYFLGDISGVLKFADNTHAWSFDNKEIEFKNTVKLAAPTVTLSGKTATWNAVDGATGYEVYVNGVKADTVTTLTYELSDSGDSLKVKAVSTAANTEGSYFSNTVTYTDLFASPVVAYYGRDDYKKVLKVNDDGTIVFGEDYDSITDYTEYKWTMEKLDNGYYMIKLANGKYLSFSDTGGTNSVKAADKDETSAWQWWDLKPDGDSGTRFKLENMYFRNYYPDVYLGEWYGLAYNGGCLPWVFFDPANN